MASLRRKPASVAATNDVDTESLPASEIPVSGTATESS